MRILLRLLYIPYFMIILIISFMYWVFTGKPVDDILIPLDDWYCEKM